jgi:hypothetical protein
VRVGVLAWAGLCLATVVALLVGARRAGVGRTAEGSGRNETVARVSGWLVALGVVLLTVEEPLLTLWLALVGPDTDRDGMRTALTPMARAHVLGAAAFGVAAASFLGATALSAFRLGEPRAGRILTWAFIVVVLSEVSTSAFVFSRGLPLPGPGGEAGASGFGWQPVAVGVLAWGAGLWLNPRSR